MVGEGRAVSGGYGLEDGWLGWWVVGEWRMVDGWGMGGWRVMGGWGMEGRKVMWRREKRSKVVEVGKER